MHLYYFSYTLQMVWLLPWTEKLVFCAETLLPQGRKNIFQFTFYLAQIINYSEKVSRWIFLHKSSLFLYIHILFISSPSQGPCCTAHCFFKLKTDKCRNDSDCAREGMCNGFSALCPASEPKPNFTDCNRRTQVCLNGVCFFVRLLGFFTIICNSAVVYCKALHCEVIWFQYLMENNVRIIFFQ